MTPSTRPWGKQSSTSLYSGVGRGGKGVDVLHLQPILLLWGLTRRSEVPETKTGLPTHRLWDPQSVLSPSVTPLSNFLPKGCHPTRRRWPEDSDGPHKKRAPLSDTPGKESRKRFEFPPR